MNAWHVFSFVLGALSCLMILAGRTRDYDYDEDDGVSFEDLDTTEYEV